MEYVKLGNSDLNVSRICLGCMGFGEAAAGQHRWTLDEESSNEIIKAALENGINFFDTAMSYQGGTSEMFVGRVLRDFARREDVVLATKFEPRTDEEIANGVTGQQHVKNCLDASLKRLGMDYVDLYICHMWDYRTPIEEIMEGLNDAVKAGKVRAIGISNCYAWQLAQANYYARMHGMAEFVSVQGHYNLIFREEEREMAPFCKAENIAPTAADITAMSMVVPAPLKKLGPYCWSRYTTHPQKLSGKLFIVIHPVKGQRIIRSGAVLLWRRSSSRYSRPPSWLPARRLWPRTAQRCPSAWRCRCLSLPRIPQSRRRRRRSQEA